MSSSVGVSFFLPPPLPSPHPDLASPTLGKLSLKYLVEKCEILFTCFLI